MKEIGMEDGFIDAMMAGLNCIIRGGYASQNDYCSWTDYRTKARFFCTICKGLFWIL